MSQRVEVDVLILGAGPTGLYAAYCAGFRGLSAALIDSLPEVGGQVAAMYPEKPIYDVAGHPEVKGRDLVAALSAQAFAFDPVHLLDQRAESLQPSAIDGRRFDVRMRDGSMVSCSAILIAGGIGAFTPRPLPAAADFLGRGVSYFVRKIEDCRDRDVVVVGGGDSAADWALALEQVASRVTLVHRRDQFRAHAHTISLLRTSSVEIMTPAEITATGGDGRLRWVEVAEVPGGEAIRRDADGLIVALGFTANLGPLLEWGLEIEGRRHVKVDSSMRSNVLGIYAAGDIATYPGKVPLISVGFGEAATAVNNAALDIDPSAARFPGHSTDQTSTKPHATGV